MTRYRLNCCRDNIATLLLGLLPSLAFAGRHDYTSGAFQYKNAAQIEFMGAGVTYSFNYEHTMVNLSATKMSFQVGAGYLPPSTGLVNITIPISINQLISFNRHHIELGLGTVLTFSSNLFKKDVQDYVYQNYFNCRIGYRYQKPDGRMQYKILFTPIYEYQNQKQITPWGGITIGYNF